MNWVNVAGIIFTAVACAYNAVTQAIRPNKPIACLGWILAGTVIIALWLVH